MLASMLIVTYLFLGGVAAGSLLVTSASGLLSRQLGFDRTPQTRAASSSLRRRSYVVSLVMLGAALACLVADLENPGKALLLFLHPKPTIITFGAYSLLAEALLAGTLCRLAFSGRGVSRAARAALEAACCVCSIAVMTYTGVFFAANSSVAFWNTGWLVALFVLSSLSGGISTVLLADYFTEGSSTMLRSVGSLQKAHLACLGLEAAALAMFVRAATLNPRASGSLAALVAPGMLDNAVVGAVAMGIVLPALCEAYSLARKDSRTIPASDAICLVGGYFLRYCIVSCGMH